LAEVIARCYYKEEEKNNPSRINLDEKTVDWLHNLLFQENMRCCFQDFESANLAERFCIFIAL
jgi:hypothetical protein